MQEGDKEGEGRVEEELSHREKVTGPDLLGLSVQEGLPGLSRSSCGMLGPHALLHGPFAEEDAQVEPFAPKPLCSEAGDGLWPSA